MEICVISIRSLWHLDANKILSMATSEGDLGELRHWSPKESYLKQGRFLTGYPRDVVHGAVIAQPTGH